VTINKKRTPADPEYELIDTQIFDDDRYYRTSSQAVV